MSVGIQVWEILKVMSEKNFVFEDYVGCPNGQPGFFSEWQHGIRHC